MIDSYSVTVLDNFRKETSDSAKKLLLFFGYSTASFHSGESPPPPWSIILDEGLMKVSL